MALLVVRSGGEGQALRRGARRRRHAGWTTRL